MTAKENLLFFLKNKQKSFDVDCDAKFSNINLKQNLKCPNVSPIYSKSKSYIDKKIVSENYEEKIKSQTWKKSSMTDLCSKYSNSLTLNDVTKSSWKNKNILNTKNKSIFSLHIAAYENSNQAHSLNDENESLKKSKSIQKQKQINFASKLVLQNPFEFLRQQNEKATEPEISQFKASQQLFNPNEALNNIASDMEVNNGDVVGKKQQNQKKDEAPVGRRAKDRLEMKRMKDTTENFDKKEAALKIVESRRTENKDIEKPKTVVAPSNMPWVPNPHFLLPNNSISALSLDDHRRYVAIITNFTRMDKALRFEFNNIELEAMDAKLKPEREKFMSYVKEQFLSKGPYSAVFKGAVAFGLNKFKERLGTLSDAGYHSIVGEVEWKSNTRSIASRNMYVKKPKVLSLGKGKKLEMPDPSRRCVFEHDATVLSERYPHDSSKSLRDDPLAFDYAAENNVTAILSSSAMRHLLTSHFPLRQYRRAFPVSIFRKFINGVPQRVVCIGNHVPVTPPSKPDLMKTFAKYVVRNAMEKQERQKQDRIFKGVRSLKRPATNDESSKVEQKKIKVEVQEAEKEQSEKVVTEEPTLMIDDEEEKHEEQEVKPTISNVEPMHISEPKNTEKPSTSDSILDRLLNSTSPIKNQKPIKTEVDVLDSILGNMEDNPNVNNAPVTSNPYSYMVVPVDNDGVHKVLVRSRPHGRDIANAPISVTTKLQYIPQCGAEESFMEEKIWNALTGALKDSTYQADIHLNIPEAHCLQMTQNRSMKMFEGLPDEAKELLSGRWQRFYNLLEQIKELQDGEYLLVENEDEMLEIWIESAGDAIWTREKVEEKSFLAKPDAIHNEPIKFATRFNGISLHTPLVWHIVKSRIPASFLPPNPNKNYHHQNNFGGGRGRGGFRGRGGRGDFRGRGGRGGDRSFRGRGGRGRGRGGPADRGKPEPVVYNDLDANPFEAIDSDL